MAIFMLDDASRSLLAEAPEDFPGGQWVHVSHEDRTLQCIAVNGSVAVGFDRLLEEELGAFYEMVWPDIPADDEPEARTRTIERRYGSWLQTLAARTVPAVPAPPPTRPDLVPAGVFNPSAPRGHLPFMTKAKPGVRFYRCEAWPRSLRLSPSGSSSIAADTFASPQKERPFLPSGFAAVARCALPSWFPACFMYEFEPAPRTPMRCGAVVPMFGQSGGGVEVLFTSTTALVGAITRTILDPL
jgi:hypothetical protein